MKALTLYQPWATLIAIGAKKIETRSWSTNYRGQLAIHVSKRIPPEYRSLCNWYTEPFATALKGVFWDKRESKMIMFGQLIPGIQYQEFPERHHLGCVIAVCELVHCYRISETIAFPACKSFAWQRHVWKLDEQERAFGDFTAGRFMWCLENIKPLPEPIPAKGMQGIWEWKENQP